MILGIDISYYDPKIEWSRYSWSFAFIKVSEGTYLDIDFNTHWTGSKLYIPRGGYHFFKPKVDPIRAADKFVEYLGSDRGELPPVLDLEAVDGVSDVPTKALAWLQRVEKLIGRKPIVYTSYGFADTIKLYRYPSFSAYSLWLAGYPWDKITSTWSETQRSQKILEIIQKGEMTWPKSPSPWPRADFVQWTGKCPPEYVPGYPLGIKEAVDINYYRGSFDELQSQYNFKFTPKGENNMPTYTYSITPTRSDGCKVRSAPITGSGNQIDGLPYGRLAYGNEKITFTVSDGNHSAGDVWLKVLEVDGRSMGTSSDPGRVGYIAEIHLGQRFATIQQINPIPVPEPEPEPEPIPTSEIASIEILNPESVTITYRNGTSVRLP